MGRHRKNPPRFPAIEQAIKDKGGVLKFCEERWIPRVSYYALQSGRHEPMLPFVMEILDYTGLTFEEAFLNRKKEEAPATEMREKNIPVRAGTTKPGKNRKELKP